MKIFLFRLILFCVGLFFSLTGKAQPPPEHSEIFKFDSLEVEEVDSLTVEMPADSLFDDLKPDTVALPIASPLLAYHSLMNASVRLPEPRPSPKAKVNKTGAKRILIDDRIPFFLHPFTRDNTPTSTSTFVFSCRIFDSSSPPRGGYNFAPLIFYEFRRKPYPICRNVFAYTA